MTAVLVDDAAHGTLELAEDGTFAYQPDADFNGTDTFTYEAIDPNGTSQPATVTITVEPVPDAPRCDDGSLSVDLDTPTAGSVHCWSPDGASPWIGTTGEAPAHGTVTDLDHEVGSFTYTPDAGFHGTDAIWFAAAVDGVPDSEPAQVTITIGGGNADPAAVDDDASVDEGLAPTATPIDVLANDTDADEDDLIIEDVTTPAHGTAVVADGKIAYTPDPLYAGTDTFDYTAVDGFGGSSTATVHVTVVADTTGPSIAAPAHRFVAPATAGRSVAAVRFSWVAPSDPTGVIGYDVEIARDSGAFVTLRSASPLLSIDRSLEIGHWYRLRVRSVDGAGNRGPWATEPRFALRANQTPAFRYRGSWVVVTHTSSAGTGFRYTTQRGASATITVTGKSFAWIAPTNRLSGRAEVLVDGVKVATVSLWSSARHDRRVIFATSFATAGTHTVTIRNLATSGHPRMSLDALFLLTR
jgi:VCBS repeat-containing protein